ncbi:MAG: (Fe-S)-binding protein [Deltaproteobacteria bacterium]|nr:(Fe-S)-binding protein [Deltaproteobacteria bacterium]
MWNASKCDLCGDCLVNCRYVDYDKEKAVSEIKLLMEGKEADILNSCITCNACFEICPTDADPANLIFKMQEKMGNNPIADSGKALLEGLGKVLEEGNGDSQLIEGDPDKPVLSLDSFEFNQFPEATIESKMFKGMTVVRGTQYMSLVGLVHMGGESFVEKYAQKVIDRLAKLGKDIVYLHNEGYALAHVNSKELGIKVPYNYMHLFEYVRDYLKANQESVTKLDKKVAYQANCATRWLPEQDGWLDDIFELIGVQRVQRQYQEQNSLCCTGPIIRTKKELAIEVQTKNVQDALDSGADALITICPICDWVLRRPTSQQGLPKIFVTDLCRMALGEIEWPVE